MESLDAEKRPPHTGGVTAIFVNGRGQPHGFSLSSAVREENYSLCTYYRPQTPIGSALGMLENISCSRRRRGGVSVLVYKQQCDRTKKKRPVTRRLNNKAEVFNHQSCTDYFHIELIH